MTHNEVQELVTNVANTQKITDGYHSFEELYHHRMVLFATICNQNPDLAWKSKLHDDGSMYDNYFICGVTFKDGSTFTYHYHLDNWDVFNVKEVKKAPVYDGHTSKDVVKLLKL